MRLPAPSATPGPGPTRTAPPGLVRPLWVSVLLSCACSSQKATESADSPQITDRGDPGEIQELFEREAELPKTRALVAPDGSFKTRTPASGQPSIEETDSMFSAKIPFVDSNSVDCFFYKDSIDTGVGLSAMLEHLSKSVEFTHVAGYRIGEAQGYPVVFVEGRYVFEHGGEKALGSVKLGLAPRFETPVLCVLDAPGYRDTFAELMTELLSNMKTVEERSVASFAEIWAYQMGGVPVGFEMTQVMKSGDGTQTDITLGTQFLPVSPSELSTSDEATIIVSDATGVLKGQYLDLEGGEPNYELELSRKNRKDYSVEGTFKGKALKTTFSSTQGLSHTSSFYAYLMRNRTGPKKLETVEFSPSIDPSAPTRVVYQLDDKNGFSIQAGSMELKAKRDKSGLPVSLSLPIGDRDLEATLIYRVGDL